MRVYVDSSALVKRSIAETESEDLEAAMESHVSNGDVVMSSTLAWIETTRALRLRLDSEAPSAVTAATAAAFTGVFECPMTEAVVSLAARISPIRLRSLDAVHLATATIVGADLVIAYDERLLASAAELGFRTSSPGVATP